MKGNDIGVLMMAEKDRIERQAELLDVQLLDVLASVEAVLRHGREIQGQALSVRGVRSPSTNVQRAAAATTIRDRADQMHSDCMRSSKLFSITQRRQTIFGSSTLRSFERSTRMISNEFPLDCAPSSKPCVSTVDASHRPRMIWICRRSTNP
jgi:hypothetical protein